MWRAFPFQVRDELGCRGKGQKRCGTLLCCVLLGEKEAVGSLSSSPTTGGPKQTEVEARSRHSCHSVYCKEWPQLCNFCTTLLFCFGIPGSKSSPYADVGAFPASSSRSTGTKPVDLVLLLLLLLESEHCVQTRCVRSHTNTHRQQQCLYTDTHLLKLQITSCVLYNCHIPTSTAVSLTVQHDQLAAVWKRQEATAAAAGREWRSVCDPTDGCCKVQWVDLQQAPALAVKYQQSFSSEYCNCKSNVFQR